jgi:hypothetical protein
MFPLWTVTLIFGGMRERESQYDQAQRGQLAVLITCGFSVTSIDSSTRKEQVLQ